MRKCLQNNIKWCTKQNHQYVLFDGWMKVHPKVNSMLTYIVSTVHRYPMHLQKIEIMFTDVPVLESRIREQFRKSNLYAYLSKQFHFQECIFSRLFPYIFKIMFSIVLYLSIKILCIYICIRLLIYGIIVKIVPELLLKNNI